MELPDWVPGKLYSTRMPRNTDPEKRSTPNSDYPLFEKMAKQYNVGVVVAETIGRDYENLATDTVSNTPLTAKNAMAARIPHHFGHGLLGHDEPSEGGSTQLFKTYKELGLTTLRCPVNDFDVPSVHGRFDRRGSFIFDKDKLQVAVQVLSSSCSPSPVV